MKLFNRKPKNEKVIDVFVNGRRVDKTKMRLGEILIRRGDTDAMDIISGGVLEATTAGMKMRQGYNITEEKFFIQIRDQISKQCFRIYLTPEEYQIFLNAGFSTLNRSMDDTGK